MTDHEMLLSVYAQIGTHLGIVAPPPVQKPPVEVPPGEPQGRAPYINDIPHGGVPGAGEWRVSFSLPSESAEQDITIPADWPNATLYCGDPSFAFMAVECPPGTLISNGTPECPFPGAQGTKRVRVTCVNNEQTLQHGCGPVGIYIRETP